MVSYMAMTRETSLVLHFHHACIDRSPHQLPISFEIIPMTFFEAMSFIVRHIQISNVFLFCKLLEIMISNNIKDLQ